MKKTYISGVISKGGTLSAEEQEKNKQAFTDAEYYLKNYCNAIPLNPFNIQQKDTYCWKSCMVSYIIELVRDCDSIYMLKGWHESSGARLEFHIAQQLGFQIYFQ